VVGNTALPLRLAVCLCALGIGLTMRGPEACAAGLKRAARSEVAAVPATVPVPSAAPSAIDPAAVPRRTIVSGGPVVARMDVSGPMSSALPSGDISVQPETAAPVRITPQTMVESSPAAASQPGNGIGVVVVRGAAAPETVAVSGRSVGPIVITSGPAPATQDAAEAAAALEPPALRGNAGGGGIGVTGVRRIASADTTGAAMGVPSTPARPDPLASSTVVVEQAPVRVTQQGGEVGVRPLGSMATGGSAAPVGAVEAVGTVPVTQQGGMQLTVSSAAALAVKNSLDMEIQASNIRQAQAQVRKAFGLDDFTLTAGATLGRRGPIASMKLGGEDGGEGTTIKLGSPDISTQQLQLVKPLFTDGKIERAQQVAMRSLDVARLSRDVVSRALDLAARQACYNVLRTEQLADVAQQQAVAVAAHLDQSRKLSDGGVVPKFEVIQAQTELAKAQGSVISARTMVETATAGLKRLLTLTQDAAIHVTAGEEADVPAGDREKLVAEAWESRPEVRAAEASVQLAEANVKLAKSTSGLTVALAAGVTKTKASFGSEPTSWQVAVSAEKPIFDGQARDSAVKQAQAQLEAAKLSLENTRHDIALEVTQDLMNLNDAQERLRVAQQGVVNAEEQLRVAKVRYENGIALGVEVIDAETALTAAKAEAVNAQYGVQLATAQLRSAVGLWSGNEGGSRQ
jgi:outer membrane protein